MEKLTPMGKKILKTERLLLRPIVLEDAQVMFNNWASDPEVAKYVTWDTHPNIEETKRVISYWLKQYQENPYFYHWAIIDQAKDVPIGTICLFDVDERLHFSEAGYCLSRAYWNQGIMTEALKAVLQYAFEENSFVRIIAKHCIENIASGRVMQKVGMTFLCTTKLQAHKVNQSGILNCYQITNAEWNQIKGSLS